MLVSLTTETEARYFQMGGLSFTLSPSTVYIFNTNRIPQMRVYDSTHTEFDYVFELQNRQSSKALIRVTNAYTAIQTASADEDMTNGHIGVSITRDYDGEEITAETKYFNVQDIALIENDGTHSWIWLNLGGTELRKYGTTTSLATIVGLV